MKSLLSTVTVLLLVFVQIDQTLPLACGRLLSNHNPLGADNDNSMRHWPWHAAVFYQSNEATVPAYQCGGTVITSNSVFTAAHCVAKFKDPSERAKISVSLGRLNLSDYEGWAQSFKVAEITLHPNYTSTEDLSNVTNDIAVIRLATKATFNNYVRPICMWKENKTDLSDVIGKVGTVTVWGRTGTDNSSTHGQHLVQQAFKPVVVPSRTCHSRTRDFTVSETNFCASFRNGTRVCDEDSGGSLSFQDNGSYYIRGIVSLSLCDSTSFTIFTDIVQYLPWIEELTCEKRVQCSSLNSHRDKDVVCDIHLNVTLSERKCEIIFTDTSNTNVTLLHIRGVLEALPDLSDAAKKFENLAGLQLSDIKLEIIERSKLAAFGRIQTLDLSKNVVTEIFADTFDDLKNLTKLGLSNNKIKVIHRDVFKELSSLKFVPLYINELETLPEGLFRNNQQLQIIQFNKNQITEIHPDLLVELRNLIELHLHQNQLAGLPAGLFRNNKKLETIAVSRNKIKRIHSDLLKELDSLKWLGLRENQLEILPEDLFWNNKKLHQLDVSQNKIKQIHRDMFKELGNLIFVYFYTNELETLPEGLFRNNQQLQIIQFNNNKITEIHPDLFKELGNLNELNLSDNRIELLPEGIFRNNQQLKLVGLEKNKIKRIETYFENLPSVSSISLTGNDCIEGYSCLGLESYCKRISKSEITDLQRKMRDKCPN